YMNHVFRDAGERHEARVELAMQAARLLDPEKDSDELARWGLLHLAVALSYAKVGRAGDAWRYWDIAYEAAQKLGRSYAHPYLIFGMGIVEGYAVTMHDDLMQGGKAVEAAAKVDLGLIPSATRRAFHIIETARGHWQRGEQAAVVHLLNKAHRESPETIRFNIFSRRAVSDMVSNPPSMLREDVDSLAQKLGVVAR
ncbi:MAG UNVERIFIED_CONTAM: DNA-binding protein, partial [Thermobifida fusca]